MSVQWAAAALQKFTWPTVNAVLPETTVAVSVITLPETTADTALPADVTASVVVVAGGLAKASGVLPHRKMQTSAAMGTNGRAHRKCPTLCRVSLRGCVAETIAGQYTAAGPPTIEGIGGAPRGPGDCTARFLANEGAFSRVRLVGVAGAVAGPGGSGNG